MRKLRDGLFARGWRRIVGLGALALAVLGAGRALAQPANDNFANALALNVAGTNTYSESTDGATREPGEPLIATNAGGASVWYTFTSPVDAVVTLTTAGSDFDTLLGVYVGTTLTNLNLVAENDNVSTNDTTSSVTFDAPAGTTFYVAVDGSSGATGTNVLNWTLALPTAAPSNDNFTNAAPISGGSGVVFGYNIGATIETNNTPNGLPRELRIAGNVGGASIWYSWTATNTGVVTFKTLGSSFDTLLAAVTGTNVLHLTTINAQNDDFIEKKSSQISFVVTNGVTYEIVIDGYGGATGFTELSWNLAPLPPNDNFASAAALPSSSWNSITGNNVGATPELQEPTHAGFRATNSVWYKWIAPQDGEVEMDTLGSSFDTVLAVYTGSGLTGLNQVAANDDMFTTFFNFAGSGQTSQQNEVSMASSTTVFPLGGLDISPISTISNVPPYTLGNSPRSYSQPYSGLPGVSGLTGLSYNGSGASALRFNAQAGTTYYIAVDAKSGIAGQFNLNWAYHSAGVFRFASEMQDLTTGIPAKPTSPGMTLYQAAETEEFGYRFTSGANANQFNTTVHTVYNYGDLAEGVLVTITRVGGSAGRVQVGYSTVDGDQLSDHYSFDTNSETVIPDGLPLALHGDGAALSDITNPNNPDYQSAHGVLIFDDFEMSKTLVIPVFDDGGLPQPNRDFGIVLFNPQRDPGENTNVSQPRLDPVYSQALVRILDADVDPRGIGVETNGPPIPVIDPVTGNTNNVYNTNYSLTATNAVFNFLKANYRIPEDVSDYWNTKSQTKITVYVARTGTNGDSVTLNYKINSPFLDDTGAGIEANNEFPLEPGSDYATPGDVNAGQIKGRAPSDFTADSESGTLTFPDNKPNDLLQPITFVVNNDDLPEFNEDFRIMIYRVVDNVPVPVGMINETTVTIMFDDEDPPAGSVDEYYNPDFGLDLVPNVTNGVPVSTTPREQPGTDAQGQVNALVIQPDDKTIIGGVFSSYNGTTRHGIARIDTVGELDGSFDPGDGINIVAGDFISDLALQPNGKIIAVGSFSSFNGNSCGNIIRLNRNGSIDNAFSIAAGSGANGPIRAVSFNGFGNIVIAGDFTSYNGVTRQHIAVLNTDGTLNTNFDAGTAINGSVYSLATPPDKIINFNSTGTNVTIGYTNVISLFPSQVFAGSVILNYNLGQSGQPDDLRVYQGAPGFSPLLFDSGPVIGTNQVVIPLTTTGFQINTVTIVVNEGAPDNNPNLNATFSYSGKIDGLQLGDLVLGGDFTSVGGVPGQDHIARMDSLSGALDVNFDPHSGINNRVRAVGVQANGQIVAGGDFNLVNGQTANHITRLGFDGSLDQNFFAGIGTDGGVYHINYIPPSTEDDQFAGGTNVVVQISTNAEALYIGGPFTLYNGTHRLGFARLNLDGSLDTTFLDTAYNQFAGLPRRFYGDRVNSVLASGVQSDGKVMIGGSFNQVGGGQFDPYVRLDSFDPFQYEEPKQRDGVRNRSNVARLIGGATAGPGNLQFLTSSYAATKSQGFIYTLLSRTNGALGYASANFSVVPGTAQAGLDYSYFSSPPMYPIMWEYFGPSRMHSDGLWGTNTVMNDVFNEQWSLGLNGMSSVLVNIFNDQLSSGTTHAQFQLANPVGADQFFLGGQNIPLGLALGRSVSPLNIADDNKKAGVFNFTASEYESSSNAIIGVMRTNGDFNSSPILVDYATSPGPSTFPGIDYVDTTGTLTFNNGDTLKTFTVQIIQSNYIASVEKTVNLQIFNYPPGSGGLTNAVLRIINPNFQGFLTFTTNEYVTNLTSLAAQVVVQRLVGGKGTLDVQFSTADGSAIAGTDYSNTVQSLHWDNGDASDRIVSVPLINNGNVGVTKSFLVNLSNASLNGLPAPSLFGSITNATVTIVNDNNFGVFQFSTPQYVVNESSNGYATITVIRTGSALGAATLNFTTIDGTAFANTNYVPTNGTLSFAQGQTALSFPVRVLNDGLTNVYPFYFNVALTNASTGALLGAISNAQVNILDAQSFNRPPGNGDVTFNQQGINGEVLSLSLQADGGIVAGGVFTAVNGIPRNHIARFLGDGTLDSTFLTGLAGADGAVNTVLVQSDGSILMGGSFGNVDNVVRNHIARVVADGTLDSSFSPGAGADNSVFSLGETFIDGTRRIYIGGAFTMFGGVTEPGIVRLTENGTVDTGFASTGVNGIVYAIATYPTNSVYAGKVVIGGSFTTVDGVSQANIARLNADGSLDTNFVVNADAIVRALAIENDGSVLAGGEFTHVNGGAATRLAHINTDGSLDTAFSTAAAPGIDFTVNTIGLQSDNRIVVGGQFLTANGLIRNHIARLLPTGAPDYTINFGDGANGDVDSIVIQPDDQMILLGGGFTEFNDGSAPYLTRLYGGSVTGSGAFEFSSAAYSVNETGLQAAITVRRTGGSAGPNPDGSGSVSAQFSTLPGTGVPGVNYTPVTNNVVFGPGQVIQQVFVPILDDKVITPDKTVNLVLANPTAPAILGDQTNAVLTIFNTDSAISFFGPSYQVSKNVPSGLASITIIRTGGAFDTNTVGFATTTNGTAVIGTDYTPTNSTVTFNPGDTSKIVQIAINNNNLPEGDRTVTMLISNLPTGTVTLASPTNAVLTIKDTAFSPGQLSLSSTNYFVNEGDGTATITVIRTGGSSGTVSAYYYTTPGTAIPGLNYISVSNSISFSDGQTNRIFTVPLIDNNVAQSVVSFNVSLLTNLSSGTTLAYPSNAQVFISDNDRGFAFSNPTNTALESAGQVVVSVLRIGPTNDTAAVDYATHDITAIAGTNYQQTSGTLTFTPGQTAKSVLVPLIDDPQVTGDLIFSMVLSTNANSLGAQLAYPSTNIVVIHDADAGLSFTNSSMVVRRDAGIAVVTVVCSNPSIEPVNITSNTPALSVQYATADGTAVSGVDYLNTSGTMLFTGGNGTNTFTVPIINNQSASGERSFSVQLFNPTGPGRLVAPSNQTITIIDATAGFRFSNPNYAVNKTAGSAIINVFRTGLTDEVASVNFSATNGSGIDGLHYYATNGTLVFTNGVTNQTFSVQVIDTTSVQPNKTVLLQLSSPSNSVLTAPSAATLTIRDNTGSFVVPAGSALVSESGAGAPNGVIDSNETVTVLFGFRDAGGLNVGNLSATLIAGNGVTPSPNPSTQVYGPLVSGSHSVSKPFTFTALGTNGQEIIANFQLQDSGTNIGAAVFGYVLGSSIISFTNSATIIINDDAIASPYPSAMNISNVVGTVLKATLTLSNLAHASPHDIDALLVSPDQQTTLFMAHAGGQNAITNVTITFDDDAPTLLPPSGQIISGTNKPSAYLPIPVFP